MFIISYFLQIKINQLYLVLDNIMIEYFLFRTCYLIGINYFNKNFFTTNSLAKIKINLYSYFKIFYQR
jgi:hypothetical protein